MVNLERLEDRVLLAGDINPWHNPINGFDVDQDSHLKPLDALIVLTDLNRFGSMSLSESAIALMHSSGAEGETPAATSDLPTAMVDVNGDRSLTPVDLLSLIDALNTAEGAAEPMVRFELTAVGNIVPIIEGSTPTNTPRTTVGTTANPLQPNEVFRLEVRVTDLRDDDDQVDDNTVGNRFGVFAAYPDIWWDDATAFTVQTTPLPVKTFPFALDLEPGIRDDVLPDGWLPGDEAPEIFAVPASFRNGDYQVDDTLRQDEGYNYSNVPKANLDTPGLLNSIGATTLELGTPFGGEKIDTNEPPDGFPDTWVNLKQSTFLMDIQLTVESIIAEDDADTTLEDTPVDIDVLSNDVLNQGQHVLRIGSGETFTPDPKLEIGTETLVYGLTGFDGNGATDDGSGFVVPPDLHENVNVAVVVQNNGTLALDSFTQPVGGKGTVARVGDRLRFTPTKDVSVAETDTFTYTVTDGQGNFKTLEVVVTIEPVDAAPQITAPASITMNEDTTFSFNGGSKVSIAELDGQNLNVQLVADSAITIASGSGVTITVNDGANGNLTFNGTQLQVNNALAGLTYKPDANYNGDGSLQITAQDLLPADSTPIHTSVRTVGITVQAVNDDPQVAVPTAQTVLTTELPLVFSAGQGNAISVDDAFDKLYPAPGIDFVVEVTISFLKNDSPADGEFSLINSSGLSVTGSGTNNLVLRGTTVALNTALNAGLNLANVEPSVDGLPYTVNVSINDLGNIGGAALSANADISVQVIPPERPFAAADIFSVLEDNADTALNVLANDYNYEGINTENGLNITGVTQPTHGSVVIANDLTSVLFTPDPDFVGQTTFTYTIEDIVGVGDGPSTATVTVNVVQVNDEPGFTAVGDPATVLEDAGTVTVPSWVTDFEPDATPPAGFETTQGVQQYIISNVSNASLFDVSPEVATNGTLTYTLKDDANGSSTFDVQVQDNGGTTNNGDDTSQTHSFTINVTAVNDPPIFTATDPPAVNEDSGAKTLNGWASNFVPGPSDESTQTVDSYTVTEVSNTDLFSAGPAVDINGNLTYTPADDQFGTSTFKVTVKDSGGVADGGVATYSKVFTITINSVNDEPDFTASADPLVSDEDQGQVTQPGWITAFMPDMEPLSDLEDGQAVLDYVVTVTEDNDNLFVGGVAPDVDNNGQLTYTAAPDASGTAKFTVAVRDDGGTANNGDDTSQSQQFTINVTAVNDPPMFAATNPPAVNEDSGAKTVNGWASNFNPGPSDESTQTVDSYTVTEVSNTALFSAGPVVDINGNLTYTPADDQFGTSTFKVTVKDSGGVANGGVDTYSQIFTITINSVNDEPDFTASADPLVSDEDQGQVAQAGWITAFMPDMEPLSDLEDGQAVLDYVVNVTEDNDNLFVGGVAPDVDNNGQLTYTAAPDASGTAKFTVAVRDNGGTTNGGDNLSQSQEFTITVQSENDAPVNLLDGIASFADPANTQSTDDGVDLAFNTANGNLLQVTDVDDDGSAAYTVDLTVIGGDTKGTLSFGTIVSGATGDGTASLHVQGTRAVINMAIDGLVFHPADGLNNEDVLVEFTSDDGGTSGQIAGVETDSDTITIAVAPINDKPEAQNDDITTAEASSVEFNVMADNGHGVDSPGPNEGFQDIDILSFDTTGTIGTVELLDAETGDFRYSPPNSDYNGRTTFTYTIQDNGQSRIDDEIKDDFKQDTATVTITVTEVNDPPTAENDLLLMQPNQGNQGQVVRFSVSEVLGNDSPGPANESSQTLRVVSVGNSEKGATVSLDDKGTTDPSDDEIVYTVPAGFDHVDRIDVTISDDGTTNGQSDHKTATSVAEIRDVVRTRVSGYAYVDADQQEDMDAGEFGLGGTRITLSGFDISGLAVQRTTMTDSNGYYEFDNVMPNGDSPYVLSQHQLSGWLGGAAVPGSSGGVANGPDQIAFSLPVTGVGDDPANSAAANYNFTEWGLMASHISTPAADLLHSGPFGGNHADFGIVFASNAAGELEWYIDVGGWDNYVPGTQSQGDVNTYLVSVSAEGTAFTNVDSKTPYQVPWTNANLSASFLQGGGMVGRVLEAAGENGLPTDDVAGGEGEGYDDFVSAVDSIFGEGGLD